MSKISADDVRKVAKLARLDLPEDTIATYTAVSYTHLTLPTN